MSMGPCTCDCCRASAARFTMDDIPREAGFFECPPPPGPTEQPKDSPRCNLCRDSGHLGAGRWRQASPCPECSRLSPEVFRRVRAERDRLRAAKRFPHCGKEV